MKPWEKARAASSPGLTWMNGGVCWWSLPLVPLPRANEIMSGVFSRPVPENGLGMGCVAAVVVMEAGVLVCCRKSSPRLEMNSVAALGSWHHLQICVCEWGGGGCLFRSE